MVLISRRFEFDIEVQFARSILLNDFVRVAFVEDSLIIQLPERFGMNGQKTTVAGSVFESEWIEIEIGFSYVV